MGKDITAIVAGLFAGVLVFIAILFTFKPVEAAIEIATRIEVIEDIIIPPVADCVEIFEYNMNTGKKILIDCVTGEK